MSGKTLFAFFSLTVAACQLRAAERLYLTGWAEFGGVSRAVITRLPENQAWIVRSDRDVAGFRLERLDATRGRAWVRRGAELLDATLVSSAASADPLVNFLRTGELPPDYTGPWPGGYEPEFIRLHRSGRLDISAATSNEPGRTAAGPYIGALRAYARTLPETERVPVERELSRYSAGALQSSSVDSVNPERDVAKDAGAIAQQSLPLAPASASPSVADANALFLKMLVASPAPELGSLIGAGLDSELPRLRRLLLSVDDPAVQLRLRQQLDGYSAPPIAPYVRDEQGEWIDSKAVEPGG